MTDMACVISSLFDAFAFDTEKQIGNSTNEVTHLSQIASDVLVALPCTQTHLYH